MPLEARLDVGGCRVVLLGTIPGFVPDQERVRSAIALCAPEAIALGVPPEDLPVLDDLASATRPDLMEPDALTERFLDTLRQYGDVRIPSPDLEEAHARAKSLGVPLVAIDMDDTAHAELYTESVKFRHVLRSNSRYKRLLRKGLKQQPADPYGFAKAWDAATLATRSLREVEAAREATMARRLREAAKGKASLVAIVPAARFDGVAAHLRAQSL